MITIFKCVTQLIFFCPEKNGEAVARDEIQPSEISSSRYEFYSGSLWGHLWGPSVVSLYYRGVLSQNLTCENSSPKLFNMQLFIFTMLSFNRPPAAEDIHVSTVEKEEEGKSKSTQLSRRNSSKNMVSSNNDLS